MNWIAFHSSQDMRKLIQIFLLVLIAACITACHTLIFSGKDYTARLPNDPTLQNTFKKAKENDRSVLVVIDASWCPTCKKLNRETIKDPRVVKTLKNYELLIIDGDKNRDLAKAINGKGKELRVPTSILYSSNGKERKRFVGFVKADRYNLALKRVLRLNWVF